MSQHHARINRWRWAKVAQAARARAGYRCELNLPGICTGYASQADHIRSLEHGGDPYDPANVRASCRACNNGRRRKTQQLDDSFN